ncbi:MAG: IPT/TIG domain-containing protein [Candidatus Eisenbacteria bacterium]|uniref:IPT/TIG domain-containing protein n=1 Tax=Eiseniibacteriota bacterium TaxID=2212470 RepID=A0A956SE73_UNCEI|nr:IPT/TIG domain-containing protein [Candidatus Eisenbacteria bacterium]
MIGARLRIALTYTGVVLVTALAPIGCGDDKTTGPASLVNMEVVSVAPSSLESSEPTELSVSGARFNEDSVVLWDGQVLETAFVDPTSLTAWVTANHLRTSRSVPLAVSDTTGHHRTSNVVHVDVRLPSPTPEVSLLLPRSADRGEPGVSVGLFGHGFTESTEVFVDGWRRSVEFVTARLIRVHLDTNDLAEPGTLLFRIENPAPGGGAVEAEFQVVEAAGPLVLLEVSPPRISRGDTNVALHLVGSGFRSWTTVFVDGEEVPATYDSPNSLTLPFGNRASRAGTYEFMVEVSPDQRAGPVYLTVVGNNPDPVPETVTPTFVRPGEGPVTFTIRGAGFVWGTEVFVEGAPVEATYHTSERLTFVLGAERLSEAAALTVTVSNAGAGSGEVPVGSIEVQEPLDYITYDLCFDAARNVLYAAASGNFADGVLVVDVDTWTLERVLDIGLQADNVALSDDGRYLYVGFRQDPIFRRFDLEADVVDLEVGLTDAVFDDPVFAERIVPIPGTSRSCVVIPSITGTWRYGDGVQVFDDGVRLPEAIGHFGDPTVSSIVVDPSGEVAYGANLGISSNILTVIGLTENGAEVRETHPGLIASYGGELLLLGDRLYTSPGSVIDVPTRTRVGDFRDASSRQPPVAAEGLIFLLRGGSNDVYEVVGYDPGTYLPVRRGAFGPISDEVTAFEYVGGGRFAISTESLIYRVDVP